MGLKKQNSLINMIFDNIFNILSNSKTFLLFVVKYLLYKMTYLDKIEAFTGNFISLLPAGTISILNPARRVISINCGPQSNWI